MDAPHCIYHLMYFHWSWQWPDIGMVLIPSYNCSQYQKYNQKYNQCILYLFFSRSLTDLNIMWNGRDIYFHYRIFFLYFGCDIICGSNVNEIGVYTISNFEIGLRDYRSSRTREAPGTRDQMYPDWDQNKLVSFRLFSITNVGRLHLAVPGMWWRSPGVSWNLSERK